VPPPSLRIPISGTDASYLHQSQINIPLSLPAGASVTVVAVSSGSGAATVTPSSLSTSGKVTVTLSGTSNSQVAGDMCLQVMSGTSVIATSSPFTVSTWPTALALTTPTPVPEDNLGLTVNLVWTSESGSVGDLGNCDWLEQIAATHWDNPPFTASADFGIAGVPINVPANDVDHHDYDRDSVEPPPLTGSYAFAQNMTWWDTVMNTPHVTILSDTISHVLSPRAAGGWYCTTSVTVTSPTAEPTISVKEAGGFAAQYVPLKK